ncbi:glycosyltransferase family 4 protein [Prosthecobacter sp.]|uniref:glycosyltransferase family 4 protein n=1 Tax=Prosthecobacter sp. TaxID=1965333 RepID=UPI00248859E9|nr:glycosyltransferase family 4 protein [Prosthecobacter sp.]MDI1310851.1 glycosyltransferase family 4 protein [Prosthecobacter sp.]
MNHNKQPQTHLYFTVREFGGPTNPSDPRKIRAGGFLQVLNYTSRWRKNGVVFHVCIPCGSEEQPGTEEFEYGFWHRFAKHSQLGPQSYGNDEALKFAISTIAATRHNNGEASLLMPTELTPTSTRLLHEATASGIASVMPVHMFPDPIRRFSIREHIRTLRLREWYKPVTALHANSEVSAQAMAAMAGKPPSWAKVIVTGVDLSRFRPVDNAEEKADLRQKLNLPKDRLVVLFVGGATARKGVDFLLDAWEEMMAKHSLKATLLFVGGDANRPGVAAADKCAYKAFADHFSQRLAEVSQTCDVRVLPHNLTVQEYYRAADVFAFPSLQEGLPNAVLEAMASGLPVVSSRFLGFPYEGGEFGFEGQHFISLPRDTAAWSETLVSLERNSERRERIGLAARRWMECYQDLNMVTAQSAEFFHGLARSLHARSRTQ